MIFLKKEIKLPFLPSGLALTVFRPPNLAETGGFPFSSGNMKFKESSLCKLDRFELGVRMVSPPESVILLMGVFSMSEIFGCSISGRLAEPFGS